MEEEQADGVGGRVFAAGSFLVIYFRRWVVHIVLCWLCRYAAAVKGNEGKEDNDIPRHLLLYCTDNTRKDAGGRIEQNLPICIRFTFCSTLFSKFGTGAIASLLLYIIKNKFINCNLNATDAERYCCKE
jgi:hypothetical protein